MYDQESLYYIVEFSDGMQLIPSNWFNASKTKAYWPNFTNLKKYDKSVQNMEPVGKNWTLCDVLRILGSAESFESGKRKLKLAEMYSDLNTDVSDDEQSKKDRKIRAAKQHDNETDSDSETDETVLAPFPKLHSSKAINTKKTIPNNDCENVLCENATQQPTCSKAAQLDSHIKPASKSKNLTKTRKNDEIQEVTLKNKKSKKDDTERRMQEISKENMQPRGEKEFQQFMIENMIDTKYSLKRCENILANILTTVNTSDVSKQEENSTFTNNILDEFPIADLETVEKVEHQLQKNKSYKNAVVKMLSMVGGHGLKSIVLNILTRTLNNTVATKYSWVGGKKKLVFSNLFLWKIILDVVRRHIPNAIESDISKYIKIWLAHAPERLQREERKNEKQVENASDDDIRLQREERKNNKQVENASDDDDIRLQRKDRKNKKQVENASDDNTKS
ncbi:uncharacterized protein [Temnothorax longispinosus]|uniref:uncharacterized protein n=1 Tax=Temnothorax longispinosus TaxID=300112 RepID=UPI003A9945D1